MPTELASASLMNTASGSMSINDVAAERKARRFWVSYIVMMLGVGVGLWIYVAYLAVNDPSMAVVHDYHQKALKWDDHLAIQEASKKLGWVVQPSVRASKAGSTMHTVELFVRSNAGEPITGGTGSLTMYHHARGKQIEKASLVENEPGTYSAEINMDRDGLWQVEIELNVAEKHFEYSATENIQLQSR
jgi:nitrogen fixation protein FixH